MRLRVEAGTQLVEYSVQVGGHRAQEFHASSVFRVSEHEARGVEERPVEMGDGTDVSWHATVHASV